MRNLDRNKWVRLGLSLVVALLVWYYVNGDTSSILSETVNDVPLTMVNADELQTKGLSLQNNNTTYYVNLQVQGSERSLRELDTQEIVAEVDLGAIDKAGTYDLDVVIKGTANSIIINRVIPEKVTVVVDEITKKDFTPEIVAQGKPAEGEQVITATTTETVNVDGPSDELEKISSVSGTIDVNGISENREGYVELHAYDKDGTELKNVSIYPSSVYAYVVLGVAKEVKLTTPQIIGTPAEGYLVTGTKVSPDKVRIAGKEDKIKDITSISPSPIEIDSANNAESFTVEDTLDLPEGVKLIADKDTVDVIVEIEQKIEKRYTIDSIQAENLASGTKVQKINTSSVTVRISGTPSTLAKIDTSKLEAVIDAGNRSPGTYTLPVTVKTDVGSVVAVTPAEAEITIE